MLSFQDFETSARAVLSFLHGRFGFDLWMLTRTEGDDWIVLQSEDHGYGVEPGMVFRWAETFCAEMVQGNGPCIAPQASAVPAYAGAPISQQLEIQSYIGIPLLKADGSLFGTLCAIHPSPQPDSLYQEEALIRLLGASLNTILQLEIKLAEEARHAEKLQVEALTDALTGIFNRRAWEELLAAEEERCRRYGHPAAVIIIDINCLKEVNDSHGHASGDTLIRRTAHALQQAARSNDTVARLGGDEFGVLAVKCDRGGAEALCARIRTLLAQEGVSVSLGYAMRRPDKGLKQAVRTADEAMYQEKQHRRCT